MECEVVPANAGHELERRQGQEQRSWQNMNQSQSHMTGEAYIERSRGGGLDAELCWPQQDEGAASDSRESDQDK